MIDKSGKKYNIAQIYRSSCRFSWIELQRALTQKHREEAELDIAYYAWTEVRG